MCNVLMNECTKHELLSNGVNIVSFLVATNSEQGRTDEGVDMNTATIRSQQDTGKENVLVVVLLKIIIQNP